MTAEQKAAYVIAQAAELNLRVEMMRVANVERENHGYAFAYGEDAFAQLLQEYSNLSHNALIELFHS